MFRGFLRSFAKWCLREYKAKRSLMIPPADYYNNKVNFFENKEWAADVSLLETEGSRFTINPRKDYSSVPPTHYDPPPGVMFLTNFYSVSKIMYSEHQGVTVWIT